MITTVTQRWREQRGIYRPAGEVIDPRHYEVAALPFAESKTFVIEHHYAGSMPAAMESYGLFWGGLLVGTAVYSYPMNDGVLARLPCDREEAAELGRLVLLDRVPMRRTALDGRVVLAGHVGGVYQSTNAVYAGRATPRTLRLLPDGTVFSARAASKIRQRERGWRYSAAILERHGAAHLLEKEDAGAWVARWTASLTRPARSRGNHTYLFGLDRRVKKMLPYPKFLLGTA